MMKYTEQLLSTPLKTSSAFKSASPTPPSDTHQSNAAQDNRISLTPLWEYVVRTKSLPEGLDLDVFFQAIEERLRNPEKEVRQHALRVLTDFIPVIENSTLDEKMQSIMPYLVTNLGHIGPAVRKGAIDCLRIYLNCSNNSENILKDLVYDGLEKSHENKVKSNVVIGIVIALPFLLQKVTHESLLYIIRALFEKMVQITYQEVTLRSLVRIKDAIGDERFDEYIKYSGTSSTRKDFDLLCEVYDVQKKNINEMGVENSPYHNKNHWNDFNQNIVEESGWRSDSEVIRREKQGEIIEDKVILETEIKLNSGPAITMQIHEESRQSIAEGTDSEEERNGMGIVKVLTDDSEEDYEPRRTPRRVRFGGEIVKLRTPDSDSNQPSDLDNDSTITITPRSENNSDKPLIEIHYTDTKTQRSKSVPKSNIPVPNSKKQKVTQSEPSSPARGANKSKRKILFRSSPNLSKMQHVFGEKVPNGGSRIPRRNSQREKTVEKEKKSSHTTTIQIRLTDFRSKSKNKQGDSKGGKKSTKKSTEEASSARSKTPEVKSNKPKEENPAKTTEVTEDINIKKEEPKIVEAPKIQQTSAKPKPPPLKISKNKTEANSDKIKDTEDSSPAPLHKEIEMFHNLTRSPERKPVEKQDVPDVTAKIPPQEAKNEKDSTSEVNSASLPQAKTESTEKKVEMPPKPIINNEDRHLTTADNVLLNRDVKPVRPRNVHTADQSNKRSTATVNQNGVLPGATNAYNSFQVCSTTFSDALKLRNCVDSPIPTNDNGDCLTCSSSGSDNLIFDSSWEDAGVVDRAIINNLNCKDDWRVRLRGLEDLNKVLQNHRSIEALEPKAASLFYFLFSCEQHMRLQTAAEDILKILFSNMKIAALQGRLNQIVMSLCKMGSPAGVRLSILLMRRISAEDFLDQLLKPTILGAKSSKIREGALQILMTISRIFPSTEVNVIKATEFVTPLLHDRKKRVRRASLETIAALGQLGTPGVVLDVISKVSTNYPDREQLLRVVRTRLSRKQLPAVDLNGSVRYSTPSGESEIEWISIGSATTSPQCLQHGAVADTCSEGCLSSSATNHNMNNKTEPNSDNEAISNYINNQMVSSVAPIASGHNKANYWKSNARHVDTKNDGAKTGDGNESDGWSGDSAEAKDDLKSQNLQIWAVDPWTLSTPVKLSPANGTLRPLYVIQREQLQTNSDSSNSPENYNNEKDTNADYVQDQRRSTRGRSFSPPKRQTEFNSNKNEEQDRFITLNGEDRPVRRTPPTGRLQKSSSSDHIRCNEKTFSPSTSSSNSGASIRNANWQKNFKSGIPVPVSSDSRLRFRTRQSETSSKGPMSIPPHFYSDANTKVQ